MKTAIALLLSSKKFWTVILGGILTAGASLLARYGLEVSDAAVQQVAATVSGLFGLLLVGQGLADHGKEAKKLEFEDVAEPPAPVKPAVGASVTLVLIAAIAVAFAMAACSSLADRSKRAAGTFFDCEKASAKKLAGELKPALTQAVRSALAGDGSVDRGLLRAAGGSLVSDGARCAFDAVIAELVRPAPFDPNGVHSSALEVDAEQLGGEYDRLRAELWGGASRAP